MSENAIVKNVIAAMGEARRRAKYCVQGSLPAIDPGIEIEEFGRLPVPLKQGYAKRLAEACQPAPFGKGEKRSSILR